MTTKYTAWEIQARAKGSDELWRTHRTGSLILRRIDPETFQINDLPPDHERSKDSSFPEFWIERWRMFGKNFDQFEYRIIERDIVSVSTIVDVRMRDVVPD